MVHCGNRRPASRTRFAAGPILAGMVVTLVAPAVSMPDGPGHQGVRAVSARANDSLRSMASRRFTQATPAMQ
jgi:hypothetical protein